jgi:hypothetical protein
MFSTDKKLVCRPVGTQTDKGSAEFTSGEGGVESLYLLHGKSLFSGKEVWRTITSYRDIKE